MRRDRLCGSFDIDRNRAPAPRNSGGHDVHYPSALQAFTGRRVAPGQIAAIFAVRTSSESGRVPPVLDLRMQGWATFPVRTAIGRVVQAEGGPAKLLAEFVSAKREVARNRELLSMLSNRGCLPVTDGSWDALIYYPFTNADAESDAALTALETNADTALPDRILACACNARGVERDWR